MIRLMYKLSLESPYNNKLHRSLEQNAVMSVNGARDAVKESPPRRPFIGGSEAESVRCSQFFYRTNSLDCYIGNCAEIDVHSSHRI